MSRKTPKTPNSEPLMTRDEKLIRALVDKSTEATLEEWAKEEGRSVQRHAGILLRRLAILFRDHPEKLQSLGLAVIVPTAAA